MWRGDCGGGRAATARLAALFSHVLPRGSVFDRLLEKYYQGKRDGKTLQLLGIDPTGLRDYE